MAIDLIWQIQNLLIRCSSCLLCMKISDILKESIYPFLSSSITNEIAVELRAMP